MSRYVISYVSTVNSSMSGPDIEELMNYVKQNNNILGITGILIYSEGNFFQVLEGEDYVIKALFEKIKKDSRHYNVIKMLDKTIDNTSFSKYHSSFTVISNHNSRNELQLFLKREKDDNPEHFKSIAYLAEKFMKLS